MKLDNVFVYLAGLLFGVGLLVSGMTEPTKVQGFLDVFGDWDASLALVMGAALAVHAPLGWLMRRPRRGAAVAARRPRFASMFHLPTRRDIDRPLVVGAALFGVGWGLVGLCPGPGLVTAASGVLPAIVFVGAMTFGMIAHQRLRAAAPAEPNPQRSNA